MSLMAVIWNHQLKSVKTPVEYALLTADTNILVEMDLFWESNKNKELLQVLSQNYFVVLTSKQSVKIVLSGCVDDGYGTYPCVKVQDGNTEPCEGLKSYIEETNERFIPYIGKAAKYGYQ